MISPEKEKGRERRRGKKKRRAPKLLYSLLVGRRKKGATEIRI